MEDKALKTWSRHVWWACVSGKRRDAEWNSGNNAVLAQARSPSPQALTNSALDWLILCVWVFYLNVCMCPARMPGITCVTGTWQGLRRASHTGTGVTDVLNCHVGMEPNLGPPKEQQVLWTAQPSLQWSPKALIVRCLQMLCLPALRQDLGCVFCVVVTPNILKTRNLKVCLRWQGPRRMWTGKRTSNFTSFSCVFFSLAC